MWIVSCRSLHLSKGEREREIKETLKSKDKKKEWSGHFMMVLESFQAHFVENNSLSRPHNPSSVGPLTDFSFGKQKFYVNMKNGHELGVKI